MFKSSMLALQSNKRQLTHRFNNWRNASMVVVLVLTSGLTACVSSYQPTIVQGNQVSNNALAQLVLEMSKEEVQTILGNPLIKDPFAQDRWDYYYSTGKASSKNLHKRVVTLKFADNRLLSISGDVDFDKVAAARENPEQEVTGGTIITKPTQKKKGIFSRQ